MSFFRWFFLGTVFVLCPTFVSAQWADGNKTIFSCRSGIMIDSFISGVLDTITYLEPVAGKAPYCLPAAIKVQQLAQIYCQFLERHPERWHLSASGLAISAWQESFPCGSAR
jgi:hypothetical protein